MLPSMLQMILQAWRGLVRAHQVLQMTGYYIARGEWKYYRHTVGKSSFRLIPVNHFVCIHDLFYIGVFGRKTLPSK